VYRLQISRKKLASVSTKKRSQLTLQEAPIPFESCPTAVINAPVDVVSAFLIELAAWGRRVRCASWQQIHLDRVSSDKKINGETGLRIVHLRLTFRMIEIDLDHHRLRLNVTCRLVSLLMRNLGALLSTTLTAE
jgi:hypothetical protein